MMQQLDGRCRSWGCGGGTEILVYASPSTMLQALHSRGFGYGAIPCLVDPSPASIVPTPSLTCNKVRTKCRRPPHRWFPRTRTKLTLHATHRAPHDTSRLVHATSSWSVKPDMLCPGILWARGSMFIPGACMTSAHTPPLTCECSP